jgi:hypothetical protein
MRYHVLCQAKEGSPVALGARQKNGFQKLLLPESATEISAAIQFPNPHIGKGFLSVKTMGAFCQIAGCAFVDGIGFILP